MLVRRVLIIKKINSKIPLFYQIRNLIPNEKKILLYNSLILPNIIYGIEIYGKSNCIWMKTLQKAQNRILKILLNLNIRTSTNGIHKTNNVLKITDMNKLRTILIGHRAIHFPNVTNAAHSELKRNIISERNMRYNINFRVTTESYSTQNKILENTAILWNQIPEEILKY